MSLLEVRIHYRSEDSEVQKHLYARYDLIWYWSGSAQTERGTSPGGIPAGATIWRSLAQEVNLWDCPTSWITCILPFWTGPEVLT